MLIKYTKWSRHFMVYIKLLELGEILRKFGLSERKSASTPIDVEKPLLKDSDGEDVDVHTYSQENLLILEGKALFGLMVSKGFTL
uniref:Uncharacterized protein n=1 Tax=Tanacetum cinerariifolium TaxID=118510 RepID=A0A699QXH7_TANCI|nr:hypothetical protein [Tanacetum cinerariifolium]